MTPRDFTQTTLLLIIAGLVSACGSDQVNRTAPSESSAELTPRVDNVSAQDLSAGIEAMKSRVLRTADAFSKIEPTSNFRYFMHPTIDQDAVIEFDVSGLSAITLSPRIAALDRNCLRDPMAGEVEFSYALDTTTPTRLTVDRKFDRLLVIEVGDSRKMTVSVNQGNGVVTCDWFGLGLSNVIEDAAG